MKFLTTISFLFAAYTVDAFPTLTAGNLKGITPENLNNAIKAVETYRSEKRFIIDSSKPIDITGKHAFQAPGKNDQRGPCPGLNALANHNYISHDGITSYAEVVTAINQGLRYMSSPKQHEEAYVWD